MAEKKTKPTNASIIDSIVEEFPDDVTIGQGKVIVDWVDTGCYAINRIVSGDYFKGYPCGKIIEVYGDPSTGKSYLIQAAVATWQRKFVEDGFNLLDDVEDAYMPVLGEQLGIDNKRLIIRQSQTVEGHFRLMFSGVPKNKEEETEAKPALVPFILSKNPKAKIMIALDSVAMLSTDHQQKTDIGVRDMSKAQLIRAGITKHWGDISAHGILYIIANHTYEQIQTFHSYGPQPKKTPGGKSIPFASSVRLELAKFKEVVDGRGKKIGILAKVKAAKNKIAAPFGECQIRIIFDEGVNRMYWVPELLHEDGLITIRGEGKDRVIILPDKKKVELNAFTEEMFLDYFGPNKTKLPENAEAKEPEKAEEK